MLCPVCHVDLAMSERQGIEIDYCPQCRGVWLDRGELDKIIERTKAQSSTKKHKGYRKEYREDYYHEDDYGKPKRDYRYKKGRKKRKSALSEILDIFD